MTLRRALAWNVGTWCLDAKGEVQAGGPCEDQSTKARHRDGRVRISEEAW